MQPTSPTEPGTPERDNTPAAQPDKLAEILLRAYYRGLDNKGYSDFELQQDKRQLVAHEAAAVAKAEKALLEQLSAKLQEYIDFPIKSNTAVESSLKQTRLGHIQAKRLIDVELQRHAQEGGGE